MKPTKEKLQFIRLFFFQFAPKTEWADGKENEDEINVWEDNWDDDNVEDDFNQQLRAQLESQKK